MASSILNDTKKALGVDEDATEFDTDIIMHINSAFFLLNDMGVGVTGFNIEDSMAVWEDFLGERKDLSIVKSYVYVVVRLVFDRPETSYGIQALERMRDEWAWRLELRRRETPSG